MDYQILILCLFFIGYFKRYVLFIASHILISVVSSKSFSVYFCMLFREAIISVIMMILNFHVMRLMVYVKIIFVIIKLLQVQINKEEKIKSPLISLFRMI